MNKHALITLSLISAATAIGVVACSDDSTLFSRGVPPPNGAPGPQGPQVPYAYQQQGPAPGQPAGPYPLNVGPNAAAPGPGQVPLQGQAQAPIGNNPFANQYPQQQIQSPIASNSPRNNGGISGFGYSGAPQSQFNTQYPQNSQANQGMPTADTTTALNALFPQQNVDNNMMNAVTMSMSMRSEGVNQSQRENDVALTVVVAVNGYGNIRQTFVSNSPIAVRNLRNLDVLDGDLVASPGASDDTNADLGGGSTVHIHAQRTASPNAQSASRNAWTGTLSIFQDNQELVVGRFSGFAQ